jgi:hypothetical protein
MNTPRLVLAAALAGGLVALPGTADAQSRGGGHAAARGGGGGGGAVAAPHGGGVAVTRGAPAGVRTGGVAVPRPGYPAYGYHYPAYGYGYGYRYPYYGYGYRYPYYAYPYYWGYPYYYGYPYYGGVSFGVGVGFGWGSLGFAVGYPAYGYGYPYAAPYYGASYVVPAHTSGGIRIDVPQRDAEVMVDGYFAGTVEEFNGRTQQLDLAPGAHHIEIRANGFEPASFDVNVDTGRTITYRAALRPAQH